MTTIEPSIERTGWLRGIRELDATVQRVERGVTRAVGNSIAQAVRDDAPRDTGAGVRTIQYSERQDAVIGAYHMWIQEVGRQAGSPMPPVDAIAEWLRRQQARGRLKGASPFVIARAIGRNGIAPRKYAQQAARDRVGSLEFEQDVKLALQRALGDQS